MTERRYIVGIENIEDLNYEEFFKNYLNIEDPEFDSFVETYCNDLNNIKEFKKEFEDLFNTSIDDSYFMSDNYFVNRSFAWRLSEYIADKGIPIKVEDISGWDPQIIILSGDDKKLNNYLKNPEKDLEKRFSYMEDWARNRGLTPKKEESK